MQLLQWPRPMRGSKNVSHNHIADKCLSATPGESKQQYANGIKIWRCSTQFSGPLICPFQERRLYTFNSNTAIAQ